MMVMTYARMCKWFPVCGGEVIFCKVGQGQNQWQ